jgi:aminoglycoside/choline kinase family phosphotransferase
MERFNGVLNPEAESTAETISKAFPRIADLLNTGNQVMSHWDYRVENIFFNEQEEFVLIDWQLMMVTNSMTDFAYLLSTNIDVAIRRDNEAELVALFLDGLRRAGIKDFTMNHLHRDYRLSLLGISAIPVLGGAVIDINNKRSMALFEAVSSRLFQTVEDWDALKVIT